MTCLYHVAVLLFCGDEDLSRSLTRHKRKTGRDDYESPPLALPSRFSYLRAGREAGLTAGFPFKARPTVIMDAAAWRADHF